MAYDFDNPIILENDLIKNIIRRLLIKPTQKIHSNPLHCGPLTIFHHGAKIESQNILKMADNTYEPEATAVFIESLQPGINVVDVGAYLGYYSLLAASKLKETGSVWAFEPVRTSYELLKKNVAINHFEKTILPICMAVGSTVTTMPILRHGIPARSSFYYRNGFDEKEFDLVEVITLDSFFSALDWPSVDLIKVDVEGAEKEVFIGMKELSRRNPNMKVIVEFNPATLYPAGVDTRAFFETLQIIGLRNFYLIEKEKIPIVPGDSFFLEIERFTNKQTFNVNILCTK